MRKAEEVKVAAEDQCKSINLALQEVTTKCEDMARDLSVSRESNDKRTSTIADLTEEVKSLKDELRESQAAVIEAREKVHELELRVQELEKEKREAEEQRSVVEAKNEELEKEHRQDLHCASGSTAQVMDQVGGS